MKPLRAVPYYGGKSAMSPQRLGTWIAGQLPYRRAYIEPCAGMLGVLLQRRKSPIEVVNDADERLLTWWRMVRDHHEGFARRLRFTPYSRREYEHQLTLLDDPDPMTRATAVHVALAQSVLHCTSPGSWKPPAVRNTPPPRHPDIEALHARIADVALEHRDAVDMLERWCRETDAVIYFDPPYPSAYTEPYASTVVVDAATEVLAGAKALVAVSGYSNEWNALGWRRIERPVYTPVGHSTEQGGVGSGLKRVEVLWTNFPPEQQELAL